MSRIDNIPIEIIAGLIRSGTSETGVVEVEINGNLNYKFRDIVEYLVFYCTENGIRDDIILSSLFSLKKEFWFKNKKLKEKFENYIFGDLMPCSADLQKKIDEYLFNVGGIHKCNILNMFDKHNKHPLYSIYTLANATFFKIIGCNGDEENTHEFRINYCPFCGKRFNGPFLSIGERL
ncbi:MAG: hypothetical protein CVV64_15755 [Candidatus Wallbacteria bacterium HGW-Wallbacteria-1]|jgi:hypothetical protein|uniref:Uncharacterized protein n=1 Tax=Candidatus Wallbacteria bacterium HGW-Wallbacteria-1 TaxID=2013854 RepID=A0A2N1PLF7_9BACT|nr:MAG: hypothetical protein CVV64_15755 [Candidatus Wallbacteria bacterium HGW-Wallbacteria-1]